MALGPDRHLGSIVLIAVRARFRAKPNAPVQSRPDCPDHARSVLIGTELYISPDPISDVKRLRVPDLLIAFDVDPEAYHRRNAYIISEQGKPPDCVLAVASPSTGRTDVRDKPVAYAPLGIPEYWRFPETDENHGTRPAGARLVGDRCEPIEIA